MKCALVIGMVCCPFWGDVVAQVDADPILQIWEDESLSQPKRINYLYHAIADLTTSHPQKAWQFYALFDTIRGDSKSSGDLDELKIELLKNLAARYIKIAPDTAIRLAKQMLSLSELYGNLDQEIKARQRLGLAFEQKEVFDSAQYFFSSNLDLRRKTQSPSNIATGYSDYAGLMISKGNYDSALMYYDSALNMYTVLDLEEQMSKAYNNKGIAYYYLGDMQHAIDNYILSKIIDEKLGDYEGAAATNANIGMLYHKVGNLDEALTHLEESYRYYEDHSYPISSLKIQEALASIKSDMGEYGAARKSFSEILDRSRELDNPNIEASALLNRAVVYTRMGDYPSAILDYQYSIQIAKEKASIQNLQIALANLGNAYLQMDSVDKAIQASEQVLQLHKESPSLLEAKQAYMTLYQAYTKKKTYAQALEMVEAYHVLDDSLESHEPYMVSMETEIENLLQDHVLLSKEKQKHMKRVSFLVYTLLILLTIVLILILFLQRIRKQNFQIDKERAVQAAVLRRENMERTKMARNLHDGPNLTLTLALLSLEPLKKSLEDNLPQSRNLKNAISNIHNSINEIRNIGNNLMPKFQESGGLVSVLEELTANIAEAEKIQIRTKFPEFSLALGEMEEVQIYRIVTELLNNTIKHAEATQINLRIEAEGHTFHLAYLDNGKGMNLSEVLGNDSARGVGLASIQERAQLINATFHMDSSIGNGFEFHLKKTQ